MIILFLRKLYKKVYFWKRPPIDQPYRKSSSKDHLPLFLGLWFVWLISLIMLQFPHEFTYFAFVTKIKITVIFKLFLFYLILLNLHLSLLLLLLYISIKIWIPFFAFYSLCGRCGMQKRSETGPCSRSFPYFNLNLKSQRP